MKTDDSSNLSLPVSSAPTASSLIGEERGDARNPHRAGRSSRVALLVGMAALIGLIAWNRIGARRPHRRLGMGDSRTNFRPMPGEGPRAGYWGGEPRMNPLGMLNGGPMMPRNIVSMATRIGDYKVGVRRIRFPNDADLFANPLPWGQASAGTLIMEVFSDDERAQRRLRRLTLHCTLRDDQGGVAADLLPTAITDMDQGRIYRFAFRTLTPTAHNITLDGDLIPIARQRNAAPTEFIGQKPPVNGTASSINQMPGMPIGSNQTDSSETGGTEESLHFQIASVPLPVGTHVYGIVSAAYLSHLPQKATSLSLAPSAVASTTMLTPEQSQSIEQVFPPFAPPSGRLRLPTRLILTPDKESRFELPLPDLNMPGVAAGTMECRLTPHMLPNGEMKVDCVLISPANAASNGGETSSQRSLPVTPLLKTVLRTWDNEPVIFTVPTFRSKQASERILAVRLHLFLTMPPPDPEVRPAPVLLFPPSTGVAGGMMMGQVVIGSSPLRFGTATLEAQRTDGQGRTFGLPKRMRISLDARGRWRFANLAPGVYSIRILDAAPYQSLAATRGPIESYWQRRFGIAQPVWQNMAQSGVVSSAGQAMLAPFCLTDAASAASSTNSSLNTVIPVQP